MLKKLQAAARFCGFLTIASGILFLVCMAFDATRKPAILIVLGLLIVSAAAYSKLQEEIALIAFKQRRSLPEEWLQARVVSRRKWRWYRVGYSRGGGRKSYTGRVSYYVTFDIEGHGEVELPVTADIYNAVQARMTGKLHCKNEVCLAFEPQS